VTQLDADGQHDPIHIPRLKAHLSTSAHPSWVVGSRQDTGTLSEWVLDFGQTILKEYTKFATQHAYSDISSGYWCMNRETLQLFASFMPPNQSADIAIRIFAAQNKLFPIEIPTDMGPRLTGQSMHEGFGKRCKHLWNVYQDVRWLTRKH
jgi:hypothetical protein